MSRQSTNISMALLQLWLEMKHMDLTFFISSLGWKLKAICTGASIRYHLFMKKKHLFTLYFIYIYVSDIIFPWKTSLYFILYVYPISIYHLFMKNIFILRAGVDIRKRSKLAEIVVLMHLEWASRNNLVIIQNYCELKYLSLWMKLLSASFLAAYLYINISLRISSIEKALIPNILMIMDETYIELLCCIV